MTGVVAGSGGTGVLPGSRPGTGVEGGGALDFEFVGGWNSGADIQSPNTNYNTGSFTALPEPATYYAVVAAGYYTSSQGIGKPTVVSGMGVDWNEVDDYYYDSSGVATGRMAVWKSEPGAVASDGALTVQIVGGEVMVISVALVAVKGIGRNIAVGRAASDSSPLVVSVPGAPLPATRAMVAVFAENHVSTPVGSVDGAFTPLGTSGPASYTSNRFELTAAWALGGPTSPSEATFTAGDPSYGVGGVVFTVAAGLPAYQTLLIQDDASSIFPLASRATDGPNPEPYDVELLTVDPTSIYELESRTTGQPGDPVAYDTEILDYAPTTYVIPGAKGAGTLPDPYDTQILTESPTTYVKPGAKGIGTDPADYDTQVAAEDALRYYELDALSAAAAIPDYETTIAAKDLLRYVPATVLVPTLADAILALSPNAYWKLDEASGAFADSSGNSRPTSAPTNVTHQGILGPDGNSYVTFAGNQKIPVPTNDTAYGVGAGVSVFFLHRPTTIEDTNCVLCIGPTQWQWAIETGASGEMRSYTMTSAGALVRQNISPAGAFVVGEWNAHVVTVSDGTTAADIVNYKNSGTALAPTVSTGAGSTSASAAVLQLTARTDTTVNGIIGAAAHFAVFEGVLTPAQVQGLMDAAAAEGWLA